jgi:hypothetical protein
MTRCVTGRIAESATLFKLEEKQRGKHAKVKEYAIQCESPEEKAAWMTSLLNSLDEMNDKRKSAYYFSFLFFFVLAWLCSRVNFTRQAWLSYPDLNLGFLYDCAQSTASRSTS